MSYLAYREKKTLDENNTVRRYRADSKNRRTTVPGGLKRIKLAIGVPMWVTLSGRGVKTRLTNDRSAPCT